MSSDEERVNSESEQSPVRGIIKSLGNEMSCWFVRLPTATDTSVEHVANCNLRGTRRISMCHYAAVYMNNNNNSWSSCFLVDNQSIFGNFLLFCVSIKVYNTYMPDENKYKTVSVYTCILHMPNHFPVSHCFKLTFS